MKKRVRLADIKAGHRAEQHEADRDSPGVKNLLSATEKTDRTVLDLAFPVDGELWRDEAYVRAEANAFLDALRERFDKSRQEELITQAKNDALVGVLTAFGLGKIISMYDKIGGDVLTFKTAEHARKSGIASSEYANSERVDAYRERMERGYSREHYEKGFSEKRNEIIGDRLYVEDAYTGKQISRSETDLDHVISGRELHDDGAAQFYLGDGVSDFATSDENMKPTHRSINRSKRDHDLKEWETREKGGETNAERYDIDRERTEQSHDEAHTALEVAKKSAASKMYFVEFAKNAPVAGVKLGLRQAIGVVLAELVKASFDEIQAMWQGDDTRSLKERLVRVGERVFASFQGAGDAFVTGFQGGVLSTLVTTVINSFITTSKRLVRVIREGVFSLFRAGKMLLSPPEGMSRERCRHDALKLLGAGATITAGVALEEALQKAFETTAALAPVSGVLSTAIAGTSAALTSALVVFHIDQMDAFGVIDQDRRSFVSGELDTWLASLNESIDSSLEWFDEETVVFSFETVTAEA